MMVQFATTTIVIFQLSMSRAA